MSFEEIKHEVAVANRVLAQTGLCAGVTLSLGHVSMRVPDDPDRFVVKGRGYEIDAIPAMSGPGMVVCDLDGRKVEGPPEVTQCFEVKIHSCIYRDLPEVNSVVHVHPRYTVLMSILAPALVPMCNEGNRLVRDPLPIWHHSKLVASDEDGTEVASLARSSRAVLLEGHGAVTTGGSPSESISTMLELEEQARMNYLAFCAAGPGHRSIPAELLAEADGSPQPSDLPHFSDSMRRGAQDYARGFAGSRSGPYRYWASLVEEGA